MPAPPTDTDVVRLPAATIQRYVGEPFHGAARVLAAHGHVITAHISAARRHGLNRFSTPSDLKNPVHLSLKIHSHHYSRSNH